MLNMDNPEEILQILERYSRQKQPRDIPEELEGYLRFVAKTGDTVFKWPMVQALYREKLRSVIQNFYETTASIADLPHYPNVDPFNFEAMKKMLLDRMDMFHSAPFTVQRLSELLTEPRKQYSRIDKFMRAIEKNVLVVSPAEPQRKRQESENGESLDSTLSMNGDICSDLDIGVENDHGAINLHDTKSDDLVPKLEEADAELDDIVPLDKLEPEVSVFTPDGDLELAVAVTDSEVIKIESVPNGSSTPEPIAVATTTTASTTTVSTSLEEMDTPIQQDQVESSGDNLDNAPDAPDSAAALVESSNVTEKPEVVTSQQIETKTDTQVEEQPQQSSEVSETIMREASPGKRTLEDDEADQQTPSESVVEPSPSKKQKVSEEDIEATAPVESTTDLVSTIAAGDSVAVIESTTGVGDSAEAIPTEPTTTVDFVTDITATTTTVADSGLAEVVTSQLGADLSDHTEIPLIVTESTAAELDLSAVVPNAEIDSHYEAPLIDISLNVESTAALVNEEQPPAQDIISMIEAPIMEQLQSTVTNPPIDPVRLPPIESIIPESSSVAAVQIDPSMQSSMEVASKVDDDLMKVEEMPATSGGVGVENKMQTDDDEAPVTNNEMDVDESSADFMDQ